MSTRMNWRVHACARNGARNGMRTYCYPPWRRGRGSCRLNSVCSWPVAPGVSASAIRTLPSPAEVLFPSARAVKSAGAARRPRARTTSRPPCRSVSGLLPGRGGCLLEHVACAGDAVVEVCNEFVHRRAFCFDGRS